MLISILEQARKYLHRIRLNFPVTRAYHQQRQTLHHCVLRQEAVFRRLYLVTNEYIDYNVICWFSIRKLIVTLNKACGSIWYVVGHLQFFLGYG